MVGVLLRENFRKKITSSLVCHISMKNNTCVCVRVCLFGVSLCIGKKKGGERISGRIWSIIWVVW